MHPDAAAIFKDTYFVEFLDLPPHHSETDLQCALIEQLKQFLLELGRDFCFIGSQYPVPALRFWISDFGFWIAPCNGAVNIEAME